MSCQNRSQNSAQTTTDPNEANRTPQVQCQQCGQTHIHTCINPASMSASSSSFNPGMPAYIDPNRPAQTLYDIEQRNYALGRCTHNPPNPPNPPNHPSQNPMTLSPIRDESVSSCLSASLPPNQNPPNLPPGPLPSVPSPPSVRSSQQGTGLGGGIGRESSRNERDTVFESDPWRVARSAEQSREQVDTGVTNPWGQYRTPLMTQHDPHPDHPNAVLNGVFVDDGFRTQGFNMNGQQLPIFPQFPGDQNMGTFDGGVGGGLLGQLGVNKPFDIPQHSSSPYHPVFMNSSQSPYPQTFPALHPNQQFHQPATGPGGGGGMSRVEVLARLQRERAAQNQVQQSVQHAMTSLNSHFQLPVPHDETPPAMQAHFNRLQQRWQQEQHNQPPPQHAFCQVQPSVPFSSYPNAYIQQRPVSYASQLAAQNGWTPSMMNANRPEFLPDDAAGLSEPCQLQPVVPAVNPPINHLLGPLLPGYRIPEQDLSRLNTFLPTADVEGQGSGALPGHQSSNMFSQNFHALGALERPFQLSDLFTSDTLPGLKGSGVGKWGAEVGDDVFQTPAGTAHATTAFACTNMYGPCPPPPPEPYHSGDGYDPSVHPHIGGYDQPFPNMHHNCPANTSEQTRQQYWRHPNQCIQCPGGSPPPPPPNIGGGFNDYPARGPPFPQQPPGYPMGIPGGYNGNGGPPNPPPPPPGPFPNMPYQNPQNWFPAQQNQQQCIQRPPPKRWLPPPAWTPGVPGGMSYREYLWTLSGWSKLTAMAHQDRGVAVGMSLGGRAGRIARGIDQAVLSQVNGLHILLTEIESQLGAELQDRVRTCSKDFKKYVRPKGMGASEFICEFERRYCEARNHGLTMSVTLLTLALLEQCQLTEQQESWVLQTVAGDLTQYDAIRRAIRRCPNLDSRHVDASAWPIHSQDDDDNDHLNSPAPNQRRNNSRPFQDSGLNIPPPEHFPGRSSSSNSHMPTLSENTPDYFPIEGDDDDDSDDDYCSSYASCESQQTNEMLNSAFAVVHARKTFARRSTGKKHFRRGVSREKKAWMADAGRNSSEVIPPGWQKEKWLARSKCPGCGSRWHRDCKGAGKTFAIMRRKGGGKGARKPQHGKGGKSGNSFGVFMTTAACLLTAAQSYFLPNPAACPCVPVFNSTLPIHDSVCFSEHMPCLASPFTFMPHEQTPWKQQEDTFSLFQQRNDSEQTSWKQQEDTFSLFQENVHNVFKSVPKQVPYLDTAFHAYHLQDYVQHADCAVVGLEPFNRDWRKVQFAAFTPSARMRYALLMDTGAPQSAAGESWIDRFVNDHNLESEVESIPFVTKLSGIGQGSANVRRKQILPTGMISTSGELFLGRWITQRLEGIGKSVPPLVGLESMSGRKMIIDVQNANEPTVNCLAGDGRATFTLTVHSGHILLPIDWGGQPMPTADKYISDPLGLNVWFGEESEQHLDPPETESEIACVSQLPQVFKIVYDDDPYPAPTSNRQSCETPQTCRMVYESEPYSNPALLEPNPEHNPTLSPPPGLFVAETVATDPAPHKLLSRGLQRQAQPTTINLEHELFVSESVASNPAPHKPLSRSLKQTVQFSTPTKPTTRNSLPKEKEPEARAMRKISTNSDSVQFALANESKTNPDRMNKATYALLKQLRLSTNQQQRLAKSATYQRKYKPLPAHTPVPNLDNITKGKWDLWEWWSGSGTLTSNAHTACKMATGPPISRETGWELSNPVHQIALLKLIDEHKPEVIYGGPTCAPWSQACTTMEPELKIIIRTLEESTFAFFTSVCLKQHREGRFYLYEQPRNSALLKTATAVKLAEETGSIDQYLCMCMHDLHPPEGGGFHMKPTVLRGTVLLTGRTLKWCDKNHKHIQLNGKAPSGGLRTSFAQKYTKVYARRCCRDIRSFIKGESFAYPADDEEAETDPYQIADDDEAPIREPLPVPIAIPRPVLKPTAKRTPQPSTASSSSDPNPFKELGDQLDRDYEDAIEAGNKAADELEVQAKRKPVPASDLIPADVRDPAPEEQLSISVNRPVLPDQEKALNDLRASYVQRISSGVTATIQAGPRMRLLQEMFGTPAGIQLLAAVIAKLPASTIPPEPVISRVNAPLLKEVYQQKEKEKWMQTSWIPYSTTIYGRKPKWVINLYGIKKAIDSSVLNPWDELAQLSQDSMRPLKSLPAFLQAIVNGSNEERNALLLGLHKRMYHKESKELRKLLHSAGVPLNILAFVDDALAACETCRAFANTSAKPLSKLSTSLVFNNTVYFDLIFFDSVILFCGVDESIRYMVLAPVDYKGYESLEAAFRRNWVSHFGPPRKFRSDRESVFNSDKFGVYLASIGVEIEMVTAGDQHTWMGILDRRVQLVRKMYPKIMRDLSNEHLFVEHEDVAAECMIAINTSLTHGGTSPYTMLYGVLPAPLFPEDSEFLVPVEAHNVFFEHQLIRSKAIAAFHAAMMEERMERNLSGRSRTAIQQKYVAGMTVDFYRKSEKKQLEGWRGPATILSLLGEGYVTLRWQSHSLDIPVNHIRPHIHVKPVVAAPKPVLPSAPVPAVEPAAEQPALAALVCQDERAVMTAWEDYWFSEASDFTQDDAFLSLVSCVALQPINTSILHGITLRKGVVIPSGAAERDAGTLFALGKDAAIIRSIDNYIGLILLAGKRHATQQAGVKAYHCSWWVGDSTTAILHSATVTHHVDFVNLGVTLAELSQLRAVILLEGEATAGPPLHELLKFPEPEPPSFEGRVRIRDPDLQTSGLAPRTSQPQSVLDEDTVLGDDLGTTLAPSVDHEPQSEFESTLANLSSSEILALELRRITCGEIVHEEHIAAVRCANLKGSRAFLTQHQFDEDHCFLKESALRDVFLNPSSSSTSESEQELWFEYDETEMKFYPLEKDCRPLTSDELISHASEVTVSTLKELKSWIEHHAGAPIRKSEYEKRTGLKGLPSRMLIEFKRKEGKLVVKCRLVLKGFAEQNQKSLQTSSPTATRMGHRMVTQKSADEGWDIEGLDISTAFLQGFSFDNLPPGTKRQPCAFTPPPGIFKLLAELNPAWKEAAEHPELWLFELYKSVYGLKDAPLMWFIAINHFLLEYGMVNCKHDQCLYKLTKDGELVLLFSLHVDDTLGTGTKFELNRIHAALEKRFGKVKREVNRFRHFGTDIFRCPDTLHITVCQRDYLRQLKVIEVQRKRGDGRTADSPANASEITLFRSLVSAIAWLGVTYPPALAAASLFQSYLPVPSIATILRLNTCLKQFLEFYQPLVYRHGLVNRRILVIPDSSLGNNQKYSQGGFLIVLAEKSDKFLCGKCSIIGFKSSKSKRVASSTLHAETLALVAALEEASMLQTFMFEIANPLTTSLEMINVESDKLIPMIGLVDCHDLLDTLCKATMPVLSNKAMILYTAVLREFKSTGKVEAWGWIDTRDNPANCLTKLETDGSLDIMPLTRMLRAAAWEPTFPYRWGLQFCDPHPATFPDIPLPPASTVKPTTSSNPTKEMLEHFA